MKISKKSKLKAAEVALLFEAMVVSIKMLNDLDNLVMIRYYMIVSFAALAISDFVRAGRMKNDGHESKRYNGLGGIFLAGAVTMALLSEVPAICAMYYFYGASLLYSRSVTIIDKRKAVNAIWNFLLILMSLLLTLLPLMSDKNTQIDGILIIALFMTIQTMVRLIGVSMSQIRFDILKKIFVRSMASEAFLGLLILMVAFSLAFEMIEPDIDTFADGMWYSFALVTTIGFGDVSAVTLVGRALSVILGVYGVIVVSLITSIIINFYNETKDVTTTLEEEDEEEEHPASDLAGAEDNSPESAAPKKKSSATGDKKQSRSSRGKSEKLSRKSTRLKERTGNAAPKKDR